MQIALTGLGRVFIQKGARNCGGFYKYLSSMKIDGIDKSTGDVTSIYAPNPKRYDEFVEVATISGAESRATSTLTGYLPLKSKGVLEDLYNRKCPFDLQVHYGTCTKPDDFNQLDSAIILKDVRITSFGFSSLTARTPEERASIDETASISIGSFYRVFNTNEEEISTSFLIADTFPIAVLNADNLSCGGCTDRSDGCSTWIVPYVDDDNLIRFAFTTDNGATWSTTSANSGEMHTGTDEATAAIIDGGYLYYIVSTTTKSKLFRTSIESILNSAADTISITESSTTTPETFIYGLAASDTYIWMVGGDGTSEGVVYTYNKYTKETVEYRLTSGDFYAIDVLDENNVVVVGDGNTIFYSTSHGVFNEVTTGPALLNYITSVHMFSQNHWIIAGSGGIYCTSDYGANWTLRSPSSNHTRMVFYDDILGYAVHAGATLRTLDSGNTWSIVNQNVNTLTRNIVVCPDDPNIYWASGGEADTPGYLLRGM